MDDITDLVQRMSKLELQMTKLVTWKEETLPLKYESADHRLNDMEADVDVLKMQQVKQDKQIDRLIVRNGVVSAGAVVIATIVVQWVLGKF